MLVRFTHCSFLFTALAKLLTLQLLSGAVVSLILSYFIIILYSLSMSFSVFIFSLIIAALFLQDGLFIRSNNLGSSVFSSSFLIDTPSGPNWSPFAFHLGWSFAQPFYGSSLSGLEIQVPSLRQNLMALVFLPAATLVLKSLYFLLFFYHCYL